MSENKDFEVKVTKKPVAPMIFDKDSPYYKEPHQPKQAMVFDVPTKSIEDKLYILFIVDPDSNYDQDGFYDGNFKLCHGRSECFRHIQTLIEAFGEDFDVYDSKVVTETKQTETDTGNTKYYMIDYDNAVSVYAFCKSVEDYYDGTSMSFKIDNFFGPPPEPEEPIDEDKLEEQAQAIGAPIDDPLIAQMAMDTFKERQRLLINALNNKDAKSENI